MLKQLTEKVLPEKIRNERLTVAWVVSVLIFLFFDVLWCSLTTFRSMSFVSTYIYALLAGLVFAAPTALFPRRILIQFIVWLILVCLLTANMMYFRTYFTAIPASSYLLVGNLNDFKASVADSIAITDSLLLLLIIGGTAVLKQIRTSGESFLKFYMAMLSALTLAAIFVTLPYGGLNKHVKHLTQQCYYTNCPPVVYTVFGKIGSDLLTANEKLSLSDSLLVDKWFVDHDALKNEKAAADLTGDKMKSIVMIFLESFESWPIGQKVEGKELTPFINSLINDSTTWYAPKVLTQVGNGRSIDAQLLSLSGMLPMRNEVYAMTRQNNLFHTLPKAMKASDRHTRTYLLSGDKGTVWNQIPVARAFGIDTILDAGNWKITDKIGNPPKLSDEALFSQTVEKMKAGEIFREGEKAFVQVIGYSSHNPFRIPDEKKAITFEKTYPDKLADYMTAVNYVDKSLRILVDYIRSRKDSEDISIVIIGDHEGLANYRSGIIADPTGRTIVDGGQYTPFIVVNAPVSGRFDSIMGQVDIYYTLIDMFRLDEKYQWTGMGFSALSSGHPAAAVAPDGSLHGETSAEMARHLIDSRDVSDIILRFDLLNRN